MTARDETVLDDVEVGIEQHIGDLVEDVLRHPDETLLMDALGGSRVQLALTMLTLIKDAPISEGSLATVRTVGDLRWLKERRAHGDQPIGEVPSPRQERVSLRPLRPDDISLIHASVNNEASSRWWPTRGASVGFDGLSQLVSQGVDLQRVLISREGVPMALLNLANFSGRDQRAEFSLYNILPDVRWNRERGPFEILEGVSLFIDLSFRTFPLRRIVAEIPGWNWDQFAGGERVVFDVEGVLREHDWFDNRWWDRRIIAITRSRWDTFTAAVVTDGLEAISG